MLTQRSTSERLGQVGKRRERDERRDHPSGVIDVE